MGVGWSQEHPLPQFQAPQGRGTPLCLTPSWGWEPQEGMGLGVPILEATLLAKVTFHWLSLQSRIFLESSAVPEALLAPLGTKTLKHGPVFAASCVSRGQGAGRRPEKPPAAAWPGSSATIWRGSIRKAAEGIPGSPSPGWGLRAARVCGLGGKQRDRPVGVAPTSMCVDRQDGCRRMTCVQQIPRTCAHGTVTRVPVQARKISQRNRLLHTGRPRGPARCRLQAGDPGEPRFPSFKCPMSRAPSCTHTAEPPGPSPAPGGLSLTCTHVRP